jgi:hypothetical protein
VRKATHEVARRAREAAAADAEFKEAHAKAFLVAVGTQEARKAQADADCADAYRERRAAEAVLLTAQEAGRNYRAQLERQRSKNANLRPLVSP